MKFISLTHSPGVPLVYLESQEILSKYLGSGLEYIKRSFTAFRETGGVMVIEEVRLDKE